MPIDPRQRQRIIADLEWYLSSGQASFQRSPFGSIYEHQQNLAYDSSGNNLRPAYASYDRWSTMVVHRSQPEPSYEPTPSQLLRFGRVSRYLAELRRRDPTAAEAMREYYGDTGAGLGYRFDNGRLMALYRLVPSGKRWLAGLKRKSLAGASDTSRLVNASVSRTADDIDRARRRRVDREAQALLERAEEMYVGIAAGETSKMRPGNDPTSYEMGRWDGKTRLPTSDEQFMAKDVRHGWRQWSDRS